MYNIIRKFVTIHHLARGVSDAAISRTCYKCPLLANRSDIAFGLLKFIISPTLPLNASIRLIWVRTPCFGTPTRFNL